MDQHLLKCSVLVRTIASLLAFCWILNSVALGVQKQGNPSSSDPDSSPNIQQPINESEDLTAQIEALLAASPSGLDLTGERLGTSKNQDLPSDAEVSDALEKLATVSRANMPWYEDPAFAIQQNLANQTTGTLAILGGAAVGFLVVIGLVYWFWSSIVSALKTRTEQVQRQLRRAQSYAARLASARYYLDTSGVRDGRPLASAPAISSPGALKILEEEDRTESQIRSSRPTPRSAALEFIDTTPVRSAPLETQERMKEKTAAMHFLESASDSPPPIADQQSSKKRSSRRSSGAALFLDTSDVRDGRPIDSAPIEKTSAGKRFLDTSRIRAEDRRVPTVQAELLFSAISEGKSRQQKPKSKPERPKLEDQTNSEVQSRELERAVLRYLDTTEVRSGKPKPGAPAPGAVAKKRSERNGSFEPESNTENESA